MPLFKIKIEGDGSERTYDLQPMLPTTYSAEQLKERQDLQALLLNRPDAIDTDLLILRDEFDSWQDSRRRIDLLALDKEANLVVVELKIEEEGGHMELQAIRYAAMVSAMGFEDVVRSREKLLTKQRKDPSDARQQVLHHLSATEDEEPSIGNQPRIILISPSFSKEISTTVLWLNAAGLDVRCLEAKPYNLDGTRYLDIQQVLPLPAAADYVIKIAEKARDEDKKVRGRTGVKTIPTLLERDILHEGDRLHLIDDSIRRRSITDAIVRGATFLGTGAGRNEVRWDADSEIYSLSRLTGIIYLKYGGDPNRVNFNGTEFWGREGVDLTLWEEVQNLSAQEPANLDAPEIDS